MCTHDDERDGREGRGGRDDAGRPTVTRRGFARGLAGTALAAAASAVVPWGAAPDEAHAAQVSGAGAVITREDGGCRVTTPYYAVFVPDDLAPSGFVSDYDDALYDLNGDGTLLYGHTLSVLLDPSATYAGSGTSFLVMCHSPNWSGVQGTFVSDVIGRSSGDPSLVVSVCAAFDGGEEGMWAASLLESEMLAYVSTGVTTAASSTQVVQASDPFAYLRALHGRLGDYDVQIRAMADTFNNEFLADGTQTALRQIEANTALQATLRTEYRSLLALGLAPDSALYPSATESLVLINDLQERLVPICQAWQVRRQYPANAAAHVDEIVAPLGQDLYPSGMSVFKQDFMDRYARADPAGA